MLRILGFAITMFVLFTSVAIAGDAWTLYGVAQEKVLGPSLADPATPTGSGLVFNPAEIGTTPDGLTVGGGRAELPDNDAKTSFQSFTFRGTWGIAKISRFAADGDMATNADMGTTYSSSADWIELSYARQLNDKWTVGVSFVPKDNVKSSSIWSDEYGYGWYNADVNSEMEFRLGATYRPNSNWSFGAVLGRESGKIRADSYNYYNEIDWGYGEDNWNWYEDDGVVYSDYDPDAEILADDGGDDIVEPSEDAYTSHEGYAITTLTLSATRTWQKAALTGGYQVGLIKHVYDTGGYGGGDEAMSDFVRPFVTVNYQLPYGFTARLGFTDGATSYGIGWARGPWSAGLQISRDAFGLLKDIQMSSSPSSTSSTTFWAGYNFKI